MLKISMPPGRTRQVKTLLQETVGRFSGLLQGPPVRFVIFTNGRTGSNLLVSLLRKHPDICVDSEIFGEYQLSDPAIREMINRRGAVAYYDKAVRRRGFEKFVGQKMIYYNLEPSHGLRFGVPSVAEVRDVIFGDPQILFIHLKRRDRFARLVSNRLAYDSGNWHGGGYKGPVRVDPAWAVEELERMDAWESRFDRELPRDRTLDMDYESLTQDTPGEIGRALAFLGATPRPLSSELRKQNSKSPRDSVLNYDELRASLAGTRHETIFASHEA